MKGLAKKFSFVVLKDKFVIYGVIALVAVKFFLPFSGYHFASILEQSILFDSRKIIEKTNIARESNDLPRLEPNFSLDLAASEKLQDMAANDYFAHISPSGITPWFWMKKNNYNYSFAGENLAIGFVNEQDTVDAWMDSPSHRANLLNSKYTEIGVAAKKANIEGIEGVLVVQMFGFRINNAVVAASPPKVSSNPVNSPILPPTVTPVVSLPATTTDAQNFATAGQSEKNGISVPDKNFKKPAAELQPIATGAETNLFAKPEEIPSAGNIKGMKKSVGLANSVYLAAISLSLLFSVLYLIFVERSKKLIFKTSINFALLVLSLILPAYQLSFAGWIF